MAERRMFAKSIIDSDTFIDMPTSSRLLYYDLSMRADDDGFVNSPKKIMRMTGASQDDLKMLIAKSFIIPFESGVVVIKHWKIHNYIQKDRYKETIYLNEKSMLVEENNKEYALDTNRIQDVSRLDTQDRLGKDRLVEDSKDYSYGDKSPKPERVKIDFDKIKEYFNTYCTGFSAIREMTDARKKTIKSFLKNHSESDLYMLFDTAQKSDFLTGNNTNGWTANFDWIIKPANAVKILEGNYNNRAKKEDDNIPETLKGIYQFMKEEEAGNGIETIF